MEKNNKSFLVLCLGVYSKIATNKKEKKENEQYKLMLSFSSFSRMRAHILFVL
jgi:hypothetical protein